MIPDSWHIQYSWRLAALFVISAVAAARDWHRHGRAATRWKEYCFLALTGGLAALFGIANDVLVTSRLSPYYFTIGKGLADGPGFAGRVALLGFQAGFGAGIIAGGCLLLANQPRAGRPALGYGPLWKFAARPFLIAVPMAVVFGLGARCLVGPAIDPQLGQLIGPEAAAWFWRVWYIHLALYLSLVIGVVWSVAGIRRARRSYAT
jgi:hypothetical protein